jgi:hypothetical protein
MRLVAGVFSAGAMECRSWAVSAQTLSLEITSLSSLPRKSSRRAANFRFFARELAAGREMPQVTAADYLLLLDNWQSRSFRE